MYLLPPPSRLSGSKVLDLAYRIMYTLRNPSLPEYETDVPEPVKQVDQPCDANIRKKEH